MPDFSETFSYARTQETLSELAAYACGPSWLVTLAPFLRGEVWEALQQQQPSVRPQRDSNPCFAELTFSPYKVADFPLTPSPRWVRTQTFGAAIIGVVE
jgi:hypothetical protein